MRVRGLSQRWRAWRCCWRLLGIFIRAGRAIREIAIYLFGIFDLGIDVVFCKTRGGKTAETGQ